MYRVRHHAQSFAHFAVERLRDGRKPLPQSSPARFKRNTKDSMLTFTLADARGALRDTMRGKIDIPSTVKEFMDLFVSNYYPTLKENIFADAPTFSTEADMYKYIVSDCHILPTFSVEISITDRHNQQLGRY